LIDKRVYLTQTDTTIGFVSQNDSRLTEIKKRPPYKHYIRAIPSLKSLKSYTRVPQRYKNYIRRSKPSTFILPNGDSYRIIRDREHIKLIERLGWAYTTSANISGGAYDIDFAKGEADVIAISPFYHQDRSASKLFKINNKSIMRLR